MENLTITGTPKSFNVKCESGLIEIKGCSIVNDPKTFFAPVLTWVSNYLKDPPDNTSIVIKIDYVDSASTKSLFEIMKYIEKETPADKSFRIDWYYDPNDPEILELGEIFAGRIKIPCNFIQY